MKKGYKRHRLDLAEYVERTKNGPCFICRLVARDPDFRHHVIYEDDSHIVFLSKGQTQYGYTLVAPKEHREQATSDFDADEYLAMQRLIHSVSEAVRSETEAERMYLLSLGSNQGNAHVHWHVVPLPAGTPYEEQQYAALRAEDAVFLNIPQDDMAALADRIGRRMV